MPTGEINTLAIANDILASGKKLYVPFWNVSSSSQMDMVRIINKQDLESLPLDKWGIPSPKEEYGHPPMRREKALDDAKLDLILVPGVAFDAACRRLGHGKGYYDRYITRCNDHSNGSEKFKACSNGPSSTGADIGQRNSASGRPRLGYGFCGTSR